MMNSKIPKRLFFVLGMSLVSLFSCHKGIDKSPEHTEMPPYLNPQLPVEERVDDLLSRMTLGEKIGQMNQYIGIDNVIETREQRRLDTGDNQAQVYADPDTIESRVQSGEIGSFLFVSGPAEANALQRLAERSRLKIPLLNGIDAIHGNAMFPGGATVFPTSITLSCTWDPELARQIAEATAKEMRATGYNWAFFPNTDILRDPRWGRSGETFGEDPLLVSRMSSAFVRGFQNSDPPVLACIKHFIAGSEPANGLNFSPMEVSTQTLYEVYLPPYVACIQDGVGSVMAAHHEVNGVPMHGNAVLLTGLLKNELGFDGLVVSDWMDVFRLNTLHKIARDTAEAVKIAVNAGVDIHMHGPGFYKPLVKLVKDGEVPESRINDAVRRILRAKFKLGLFENRYVDENNLEQRAGMPEHRQLALKAAEKSVVLLKNDQNILPLSGQVKSIFVTGPNADSHAILGDWALDQKPENVITILEGIRNLAGKADVNYYDCGGITEIGDQQIATAAQEAKRSDLIVVVVGGNALRKKGSVRTYGENVDRANINLAGRQLDLVKALQKTGKPVVVVFVTGRPTAEPWIAENIHAVLYAWEPGMEGGQAVAEVLFGKVNPSGKLTVTIPRNAGHIHQYYNDKPGMFYRKYALEDTSPLYPFGFGLSYTTFSYDHLTVSPESVSPGQEISVQIQVTNTGTREGIETVQLYLNDNFASMTRPVKELKGFQQVDLKPGETRNVEFTLTGNDLKFFGPENHWVVEPGEFTVMVGPNSEELLKKNFTWLK